MAQKEFLDNVLKEYITFRGFSNTLKCLEQEYKTEKDKICKSEKVIEQINLYLNSHDLQSLRELWSLLDIHFFNKLEQIYSVAIKKLENGVLKLYLVTAYTSNRIDKMSEFFNKLSSELFCQTEWKDWFYFPFCKNPEESHQFCLYFSKQWQDTLQISLKNLLTTIYQCVPHPTLFCVENESLVVKKLHDDNLMLRTRIQCLSNKHQCEKDNMANTTECSGTQKRSHEFRCNRRCNVISESINSGDLCQFDVPPPSHAVDDFYIIASEAACIGACTEAQGKSIKMLIKNIGSSGSPSLGRVEPEKDKRRPGSLGRSWM